MFPHQGRGEFLPLVRFGLLGLVVPAIILRDFGLNVLGWIPLSIYGIIQVEGFIYVTPDQFGVGGNIPFDIRTLWKFCKLIFFNVIQIEF